MALLNKLKSILGIGGGRDEGDRRSETSVTVEREASGAATTEDGIDEEPVAAGTDATASTGSMTDSADDPEQAAEPGEATAPPTDDGEDDRDIGAVIDEAEPSTDADESVAASTDASASTESLTAAEGGTDGAAEPGEAAGPPTGTPDEDDPSVGGEDVDDEAVDNQDVDNDEDEDEAAVEPVETITGIGPAYADRLDGAGIESVAELAAADAETVGEAIDVSPKRVADWIERANDR